MVLIVIINFLLAIATTVGMSVLPLITTEQIGISIFVFGLIEGGTEFLSNILRLVSGSLFDRTKNKKNLFILSSGLAFISKFLLLFPSVFTIITSKTSERFSNGLFAAPRDAFVGQNAKNKGLALAMISCSKTLGCVLGPLVVSVTVYLLGDLNSQLYNLVFFTVIITITATILSFFIKTKPLIIKEKSVSFIIADIFAVTKKFLPLLTVAILFFLGRFNDGMIMLYLKKSGLPEWFYLSTIGFFNMTMFIISPILGFMIDKNKTKIVLFITILALLIFNILFYFLNLFPLLLASLGLVAWGVQRVGAQITFSAMIFQTIPDKSYGTAIGIYSLLSGFGNFIASGICGHLTQYSFDYVFLFSGANALICLVVTMLLYKRKYLA